jgi:hypothetical protein
MNNRFRSRSSFGGKRSLFEIKYSVMRVCIAIILLCILIYSVPTFRYGIHRLLVKQFVPTTSLQVLSEELGAEEFYVAPKYLSTDRFIGKPPSSLSLVEGDIVADSYTGSPVGVLESVSSSVVLRLFSDPGFKSNFYIHEAMVAELPPLEPVDTLNTSSTTDNDTGGTTTTGRNTLKPALFEGSGYGEIITKLPPQSKDVKVGDIVYTQTVHGPKAIAEISRVSEDTSSGSTFTIVSAQLLVSPQSIYRVKMLTE